MRRTIVGIAILAWLAVASPNARGDDREVAQKIIQELKSQRDAGNLKGFKLDMKVENGVVLFRGQVNDAAQRKLVLDAAKGIPGIAKVVDQMVIPTSGSGAAAQAVGKPSASQQPEIARATPGPEDKSFSLREALRSVTPVGFQDSEAKPESTGEAEKAPAPMPADVAVVPSDTAIRDAIVARLSDAKSKGTLSGFGVGVEVRSGVAQVKGRVQRDEMRGRVMDIVKQTPGVKQVFDDIQVASVAPASHSVPSVPEPAPLPRQPMPSAAAPRNMQPVAVQDLSAGQAPQQALRTASLPRVQQAQPMPGGPGGNLTAMNQMGGYTGQVAAPMPAYPVPGYPAGCGANGPHYDGPNLPNYAWPGYAAYPNYAALTYPQQYSPSAWPYIGPFYPYPQVPLGWRKVSLEWDDGWWMLDFTDR